MELKAYTRMNQNNGPLERFQVSFCPRSFSSFRLLVLSFFHVFIPLYVLQFRSHQHHLLAFSLSVKMSAAVSIRFSPSRLCMLGNSPSAPPLSSITRRSFASTPSNLATWGFIGLGRMGELHAYLSRVEAPPCPRQRAPLEQ